MGMKWHEEQEAELLKLLQEGRNTRWLAAHFKTSTSSVIGKCHRMGLVIGAYTGFGSKMSKNVRSPEEIKRLAAERKRKQRFRRKQKLPPEEVFIQVAKPAAPAATILQRQPNSDYVTVAESKPLPDNNKRVRIHSKNKSIMGLKMGCCHWPMWDMGTPFEQQLYCGDDCPVDKPYCEEHAKAATREAYARHNTAKHGVGRNQLLTGVL
jgi:hypothetical protein